MIRKTSFLLVLGVALVLASAAAPKANAGVVVGVGVGAPVYPYVAPRVVVPAPYVTVVPPIYPRVYVAPRPVYRGWYPGRYVPRQDYYRFRR
jgi:hypothetical protein